MCTPLPACAGSSSAAKLARIPSRRATSRTTSLSTTARSALAMPSAAATGTSNWCAAYSAKKRSGSHAGIHQRAHHARGKGLDASLLLERERQRRRGSRAAAGTRARSSPRSLAPSSRSSSRRLSRRKLRGQHSQGSPSVSTMSHSTSSSALSPPSAPTSTRVSASGSRRRSPVDPNGLGSATGPSGVSAWLAGTQPTPARRCCAELGGGHRASAHDRAEVAADERDQLGCAHLGVSRGHGAVVPDALGEPQRVGARAHGRGVLGEDDHDHASRRLLRPLQRRRQPLLRLHVHTAVAEGGVGVGHAVQAAARAAHAADDAGEVPHVPVRAAGRPARRRTGSRAAG